jgi:hypothetical protein
MPKRINNMTVEGSGYNVIVPDIHTVIYNEGANSITIEIEGGTDVNGINWFVYLKTLSVREVYSNSFAMTKEKKDVILKRISDALNMLDMPHRLVK